MLRVEAMSPDSESAMNRHAEPLHLAAAAGLALGCGLLAGCNTTGPAPTAAAPKPTAYATQSYTPPGFTLPQGTGCTADVARWQAIQNNDYASGNIGLPVYNQIKAEIA